MIVTRFAIFMLTAGGSILSSTTVSAQESLQSRRQLVNPNAADCVIVVSSALEIGQNDGLELEDRFECVLDPSDANGKSNIVVPIELDDVQKESLRGKMKTGELVSDVSTLKFGNGIKITGNGVFVPPGLEIALGNRPFPPPGLQNASGRPRNLAIVEGNKPILVVKVIDAVGKARAESLSVISDDVFGTFGDPVNLKSQMFACSFGQLNIIPATDNQVPNKGNIVNGVMQVTIPVTLEGNSSSTIRNAVTTKVQEVLGVTLPGPFQQVMYVLEGCYVDCGWAAYAYVNSWNSVYQGVYYKQVGVQMHEIGHNFNLAHSGGLDGATYTDHTCLMGNPLYSDDVGKMCWNGAKSWQIGWYDDRKHMINPKLSGFTSWSGRLIGIANYDSTGNEPVVVKIETGTGADQFIAFNRATGVNSQNDEADDEVTIVEVTGNNGEGYAQSFLKAHLIQGESYTYVNWAGTGRNLIVQANTINIGVNPGYADVQVCLDSCAPLTSAPTKSPVTSAPTKSPTGAPTKSPVTSAPTKSPVTSAPTKSPTGAPTKSPVTSAPTKSPTAAPTKSPVTSAPTKSPVTSAPTKSPTAAPTKSPVTPAPTRSPTAAPTKSPVTPAPTKSPVTSSPTKSRTAAPTKSPVATCGPSNCGLCSNKSSCQSNGTSCAWNNSRKVCNSTANGPAPAPTPTPPTPTVGNVCSSSNCGACPSKNTCPAGCTWKGVCF